MEPIIRLYKEEFKTELDQMMDLSLLDRRTK